MNALSEIRLEIEGMKKGAAFSKDIDPQIRAILGSFDEHGVKHAGLVERIGYLESFVAESADRHNKELAEARGDLNKVKDHKTTMEVRLEYIESLIGDTADKHAKELGLLKDSTQDTASITKDIESR